MRATLAVAFSIIGLGLAGAANAQQVAPPASAPAPSYSEISGGAPPVVHNRVLEEFTDAAQPQPVYALVGGHLVSGRIDPTAKGALTLVDETQPEFLCRAASHGSDVRLACSGGVRARLTLQAFSDDAGCGHSRGGEAASLCYGFKDKYAAPRLTAPAGQKLEIEYGHLALKPAAG
jgi:hypothetical protein